MSSTNHCIIEGRFGKDVEVRFLPNGTQVAKWSFCSNDDYQKDGEWVKVPEWHDCVYYGKYAEKVAEKYQRGDRAIIQCRVVPRSYEKDGQKFKVVEMVVSSISLIAKAGAGAGSRQQEGRHSSQGANRPQGARAGQGQDDSRSSAGGADDYDDRIPF